MRIALIGVSHWHTPFYLDPLLAMPDVSVVGVSDPDRARAEEVAAQGTLSRLRRLSRDVRATEARTSSSHSAAIATWRRRRAS